MIDNVEGEPVVWQGEPSERFLRTPSAGDMLKSIGAHLASKPKITYALTNKRALVLEVSGGSSRILEQFEIDKVTVSVLNRRQGSAGYVTDPRFDTSSGSGSKSNWQVAKDVYKEIYLHPFRRRTPTMVFKTVGDVVFFSGGKMVLRFTEVMDPDTVVDFARKIVASKSKT